MDLVDTPPSRILKIGNLELGRIPRLAAPFRGDEDRAAIEAAVGAGLDIAELRIDLFQDQSPANIDEFARGLPQDLAILATIRSQAEGGNWKASESARLALYEAVIPKVDALDIELSSESIVRRVIASAHSSGKMVIASFHDFDGTPDFPSLQRLAEEALSHGADVLKIATTARNASDLRRLGAFTATCDSIPLVTICMGPIGEVSRVLFPALGSLFTFAHLGAPSAPGQLTLDATSKYFADFFDDWREEKSARNRNQS